LGFVIKLRENQVEAAFLELVEPGAFWEGDLIALAFSGSEKPIVDVNKGVLAEDYAPSHFSSLHE